MAEPLKNQYGPAIPKKIAGMILAVHSGFNSQAFMQQALQDYEALELKQRAGQIATTLRQHLPGDYKEAIRILINSLGPILESTESFGMGPFLYLPHVIFVAEYGVDHFEESMDAQYQLTQRFSAEFSIRTYLEIHQDKTLERLKEWAKDPSPHVRRLVSEGTRTRLPWASRLKEFQRDPSPVIELLELLKDDHELYVRRSVANNLNDIGKDHPDLLVKIAEHWMLDASPERQWVVKHALRSLVKQGNRGALDVLGYGNADNIEIAGIQITPEQAHRGESVSIAFSLGNKDAIEKRYMVDFRVHYVKANGKTSPKVFKLSTAELQPGEQTRFEKKVSLKEMTTRKHYPGRHAVDALINGRIEPLGFFDLS